MNPRTQIALACALLVAWVLAGCDQVSSSQADGLTGKLVLTGSSTVAPVATEIAKRFEAKYPGTRVDVQTGGSSRGIADARSGAADLGMASRALTLDERDLYAFPIAWDAVCMIVHSANRVASLSDREVAAVYRGEIHDWSAVGGSPGEISVVTKAEGRATLTVFLDYFALVNRQIQADVVIGHNEQGIKTIAGNPSAIGYVSVGAAEAAVEAGVPIRLLAVEARSSRSDESGLTDSNPRRHDNEALGQPLAVTASVASFASDGSFPMSRPLNLVTKGAPTGLVKVFIDFAQSEEVHDTVRAQHFIPFTR